MDPVISSNKESPLLTSLERQLVEDPFSYRLSSNFPNLSKSKVTVQPQYQAAGTSHGAELHFKLPRYGLASKMVIKNTMVASGNNTAVNERIGERVFSRIELRSHNKVIQTQTPEFCAARVDNLGQEANNAYTSIEGIVPTAWSSVSGVCYTPLFFSFFEKTSNFLDLSFVEELEVVCTVNTKIGMGLPFALTSGTYELQVSYVNLADEAHQAYNAKNFPANAPLTMLAYNCYPETPVTVAAAGGAAVTTTTVDLKTNNPVFATHFIIKNETDNQAVVPIDSFRITAVGREVMQQSSRENIFDTGSYGVSGATSGSGSGAVTYNAGSRVLTYFWGLSKDRTYNSGAAAFKNLNNPQAEITWIDNETAADVIKVHVVHEYYNLVSVNPSDGSVTSSLSN